MDFMVGQQPIFKHFCKVCKKGFGCGRALGGHMRAHGIADESGGNLDDDDNQSNDWEGGNMPPGHRRMYALRTNPNRQKSCKCTSDHHDGESLGSDGENDDVDRRGVGSGWSKRKRSLRLTVDKYDSNTNNCHIMSEEEELANCLMMLSNATSADVALLVETPEESCASASREEQLERRNNLNFVTSISYKPPHIDQKAKGVAQGLFECKACKKVFSSHQALGGHRASHKKVKGCFATRLDHPYHHNLDDEDVITHEEFLLPSKSTSKRKSKVHECSICHRIFSSGQALGGHKRCHWITSNVHETTSHHHVPNFQQCNKKHPIEQDHSNHQTSITLPKSDTLDLNLPATSNIEIEKIRRDPQTAISFEVSTDIILQSWTSFDNNNNVKDMNMHGVDDEENNRAKITKLSDLKDMNNINDGSSSPWLQVGIGPSTDLGDGP